MQLPDGWLTIAMLLLGVIAACSVENLTVKTTLLVFWCCWHAHRQGCFKFWMGTGAVGSLIGSVICLIAPGNFVRIDSADPNTVNATATITYASTGTPYTFDWSIDMGSILSGVSEQDYNGQTLVSDYVVNATTQHLQYYLVYVKVTIRR